jgi:hypothetical protein
MTEPHTPRQLAVIRTYEDVLRVIRARRDELDVPHEIIDDIAGLAAGHTSKLLCPRPLKHLGPISWSIFETLGLNLVAIENSAALARSRRSHKWRQRRQDQMLIAHAYPGREPEKFKALGALGGLRRAKNLSPAQRRKIARKAAQARWRKPRVVEIKGVEAPAT